MEETIVEMRMGERLSGSVRFVLFGYEVRIEVKIFLHKVQQ